MNLNNILSAQRDAYQKNFIEQGDSAKGTLWNNRETQYFRYERIIREFNLSQANYSVLDIGAGLCDMHAYLLEKNIEHTYCGVEIVPEMIATAEKKYPGIQIIQEDILSASNIPQSDVVLLSGTLNLHTGVTEADWREFAFSVIKRMFELCKVGISFNLLTSHRTFTDPTLVYFDSSEVLNYCISQLSRFVHLDHAYPLYEFSVTVFKNEFMKEQYSKNAVFDKYFKS